MANLLTMDALSARWFVKPGHVVFDIGANRGATAALYLKCGAAAVHAFEPLASHWAAMPESLRGDPAFRLHPYAVCDRSGTGTLTVPAINSGASTLSDAFADRFLAGRPIDQRAVELHTVELRTLDELDLPRANFWKIDVEGAELEVLRGARQKLRDEAPDIVQLEIFDLEGARFRATLETLRQTFAHLWALGVTSEGRAIHYPVRPDVLTLPRFHDDLRRAGTPHYYASHRSCADWLRQDD